MSKQDKERNSKVLALICARGGSKGIPRKNIKPLGGIPLLGWSIRAAKKCQWVDRVVVSTDDSEIAEVARENGAEVPFMRPPELARDDSPEWFVWRHTLNQLEAREGYVPDILINVSPTSPFRAPEDLQKAVDLLREGEADVVISVSEARRNPYFNMVEMDGRGFAYLCKKTDSGVVRRQEAPKVYDMTTVVYAVRPEFIMKAHGVFDGRVQAVVIPEMRALDIDTSVDFKFAEFLIAEGMVTLP